MTRTSLPLLRTLGLRSGRSLIGEPMAIITDTRARTVSATLHCNNPLGVEDAIAVLPLMARLDGVTHATATISNYLPDSISVSWATGKKSDFDETTSDVEIAWKQIHELCDHAGLAIHTATAKDIQQVTAQCWDSTPEQFPPALHLTTNARTITLGKRHVASFVITVDDYLAADAIVDVLDTVDSHSRISLMYRPGIDGQIGRFTACVVLDAESKTALADLTAFLFNSLTPSQRLRVRRNFHHHLPLTLLGAGIGLAPWHYLEMDNK